MPLTPAHIVHEPEIQSAIERVEAQYPQVVYINYNLGENLFGDPAIFFRIVVSDDISDIDEQLKLKRRISVSLMNEARTYENGFGTYFDIRTIGEQTEQPLRGWANDRAASS